MPPRRPIKYIIIPREVQTMTILDFCRGIVRPLIAILMAVAVTLIEYQGREISPAYLALAGGVIGWYFYERRAKKQ